MKRLNENMPYPKIMARDILEEEAFLSQQIGKENPHLTTSEIDIIVIHTIKSKYSQYDF